MHHSSRLLSFVGFLALLASSLAAEEPVSFERQVFPLLERRCNKCHHEGEQRGGLDLTRWETIRRGGDQLGAAIVPGQPEISPLIQVLDGSQQPSMPENADPLPAAEIELLRRWIAEGAKDDSTVFSPEDVAFFEREIRPVLVTRCFKCHAGDEPEHGLLLTSRQGILGGGVRGPAALPGEPESSLLLKAIRHEGELQMPRGGDKLSEAQLAAFEKWIAIGLPWPGDQKVLARERQFTISDADRKHWAFQPLPTDLPEGWTIDKVLEEHHRRLHLLPQAPTDRHRWLRRVTYDLIGYPPTAKEIADFLDDDSPQAFEKVVDRLLASPHFGWRWGQHWLDYTRNGSTGQPTRGPALDASRYAKWVADCFNRDRPWDWFARVHLAGDQIPSFGGEGYSIDQALAAAVPLNGPRTFERAETETFVLMDKLDEAVEFMGRSLMGISLECARCHDHKFDPISQRDYYALLGFFQSSGYAPVPVDAATPQEALAAVDRYRELVSEKARLHGFIRRQGLMLSANGGNRVKKWEATRPAKLKPVHDRLNQLEIEVLLAELEEAQRKSANDLAKDLEIAIADRKLQREQPLDPEYNVSTFKEMGYFISGHKSQLGLIKRSLALGRGDLVEELQEHARFWEAERLQWVERSTFGGYARTDPEVAELAKAADRIAAIVAELPANPDQPWIPPRETHLFVRVDGGLRRAEDLAAFDEIAKAAGLQFNSDNANRVFLHPAYVGDARMLKRGDVLEPDALIPRGFPVFFGEESPQWEGSGRRQLADWITRPGSIQASLVARTTVNRAWQQLFGEALCRTPKELGRLGEIPDVPELIDGLSAHLIRDGWSIKKLIRRMVLSDTYRRSSMADDDGYAKDPDNRFFSRQTVKRLDYEAVANTFYWLREGRRSDEPIRDATLAQHFDAPSHYDLTERRVVSITPTQSLYLMNAERAASGLAKSFVSRLRLDQRASLDEALVPLYLAFFQRPPSPAEREDAMRFVERRRQAVGQAQFPDELHEYATLLLCANETIYLE